MIVLLDPSLQDHNGNHSNNLGDVIIYNKISDLLSHLFSNDEIVRISTHDYLGFSHYKLLSESRLTFIGGSNILSSQIWRYNQWNIADRRSLYYLFPKMKNILLLGCGWWRYQNKPDFLTRRFYSKVLSSDYVHSLRDSYACHQLKTVNVKTLNTGCPTMWDLEGMPSDRIFRDDKRVVFTLTDYNRHIEYDGALVRFLFERFEELYFFTQGSEDEAYFRSLGVHGDIISKVFFIRSLESYEELLKSYKELVYIGTRLHGGILAKQYEKDTFIISIDNRASEIGSETNLAVTKRGDFNSIQSWLDGKSTFGKIKIEMDAINAWKSQFQ